MALLLASSSNLQGPFFFHFYSVIICSRGTLLFLLSIIKIYIANRDETELAFLRNGKRLKYLNQPSFLALYNTETTENQSCVCLKRRRRSEFGLGNIILLFNILYPLGCLAALYSIIIHLPQHVKMFQKPSTVNIYYYYFWSRCESQMFFSSFVL